MAAQSFVSPHTFFLAGLLSVAIALNGNAPVSHKLIREPALPSPKTAVWLSMGYQNATSILYWMRTLAYFGRDTSHADLNRVAKFLDIVTTLNPRADHAYFMSAVVLPWGTGNTRLSKPLLKRAMKSMPNDWRWPFYRGFNIYWFEDKQLEAKQLFLRAAKLPGAPPIVASLAAKLEANAGDLDSAENFLRGLLSASADPAIRQRIRQQIAAIRTEKTIRNLEARLKKRGLRPTTPEQLAQQGIDIPTILPDGGHLVFYKGKLVSSHGLKRYRIFVSPKKIHRERSERAR